MQRPQFGANKTKPAAKKGRPMIGLSIDEEDEGSSLQEQKEEELVLAKPTKKNEILLGGTTGDTQFDTSYSSEKSAHKAVISFKKTNKLFSNTNAKLNIDTEAINELFTYGGEKGDKVWLEGEEENMF